MEDDLGMREERGLCRNVGRDREEEVRFVQGSALSVQRRRQRSRSLAHPARES